MADDERERIQGLCSRETEYKITKLVFVVMKIIE